VGTVACRCIVTNSGSAKHRVAAAGSVRSKRAPARDAAAAGLAETSRRSWLRTMLIAAGAFASVPSLLLFSSPKAYGEGGGTDYSPKQDLDKYQDELNQAQQAAAQAQADYEKEKETNPNANMAPMLDAQGKVQGLQDMVRYEQQQAVQQPPPNNENSSNTTTTGTESNTENSANTTGTGAESNTGNQSNTTTTGTESNTENSANTTGTGTESNTGNQSNTTTTGTESNTENSANTTGTETESSTGNQSNTTTTGTESNTENSANTTGTETESSTGNQSNTTTTGTESNTGNQSNTTTTGTETTNENPPVKEPTYNTGPDNNDQSNSALVGPNDDLHDAVGDKTKQAQSSATAQGDLNNASGFSSKAQGEIGPATTTPDSTATKSGAFGTAETDPSKITTNNPEDAAHKDASQIFDIGGQKSASAPAVGAPPTPTSAPAETPFVIPDSMKKNPDVLELNNAQQQLKQSQAEAAQAEADYKAAGPNANMAPMLKAQGQLKGQQVFVNMLTEKVKAQLPRLPLGGLAAPTGQAGSAGSSSQQKGP